MCHGITTSSCRYFRVNCLVLFFLLFVITESTITFFCGNVRRRRQNFWIPSIPVQKKLLEWDGNWQTILCGFMLKILYICTCLREGTLLRGQLLELDAHGDNLSKLSPPKGTIIHYGNRKQQKNTHNTIITTRNPISAFQWPKSFTSKLPNSNS